MSILDRVTKAVGDVVDRGKKEVDQFVRIQKINSHIGDLEKTIEQSNGQIREIKTKIGETAIGMLRAGTLASPDISSLADQITGIQQQIASLETEISQKRAEIESLKAEDKATKPPAPDYEAPTVPPPPPPPPQAGRFCSQCGASAPGGSFCPQCGAKLV